MITEQTTAGILPAGADCSRTCAETACTSISWGPTVLKLADFALQVVSLWETVEMNLYKKA